MLRYSSFLHVNILMQLKENDGYDEVYGVFLKKPSSLELAKLINSRRNSHVLEEDIDEALIKSVEEDVFTVDGFTYELTKQTLIEN